MSQDEITVMDGSKCIFSFEVSDRFCQTNSILKSTRITSYLKILIRKMPLILRNISREKEKEKLR